MATPDGKSRKKKKKMTRSVVGNRATSGRDDRPIARSVIGPDDRSYDQSWHPATDRTSNCEVRRQILRSIVTAGERSFDQSLHL